MRSAVRERLRRTARDSTTISASFASDRDDEQQQRPRPRLRATTREVERHADGDEEEAEQHVAKRLDVLLDLVAVFGLGDQHAGEERAERERQARRARSAPRVRA